MKKCGRCKREKPEQDFKPGRIQCVKCNANRKTRNAEDPARASSWRHALKQKGATPEMYAQMYAEQGGVCAICQESELTRRLAVDHCHKTGKIRGLLCHRCNVALGLLRDNVDYMAAAISYLMA